MRRSLECLVLALTVSASACIRAPDASAGGSIATSAGVGAVFPSASELYPKCPAAAIGARTAVQDVEGGVALDVTGNDDATADEIRARMQSLLEIAAHADATRHDVDGDGPGLGRCPIVLYDATITTAPLDRGVRIVVTTAASEVEWLRRETRARIVEMRTPSSVEGLGMDVCPSTLPSAMTAVHDVEDGVIVTVISRDPDVAEAIRSRAWHVADASQRPGAHTAHHAPSGARACPVVLTDTDVTATDVPGGAELRVRARAKGEAADLRRVARERVSAFP